MKRKSLLFLLLAALFMPLALHAQGLMKAPRGANLQAASVQSQTRQEALQNRDRDGWLQYDDGTLVGNYGLNTAYMWEFGPLFPASMLGDNNTLSKVSFWENSYMIADYGVTVNVYQPDTTTLVYQEDFELNGSDGMHEVEFSEPVTIDPTQDLWITITVAGTYVFAVCQSTDPNNDWVDWAGWRHGSEVGLTNLGWMIRGYVENVNPDACPKPTGLTVDNITGHTATFNWSSTSGSAWQLCINDDESHLINVNQNPTYTLSGLASETSYTVRVRTKCSDTDLSSWTSNHAFTTDVACHAPEVTIADIASTSANVNWTTDNSVQLRYRVAPASIDFEDGTLDPWTTIDADGDGYTWEGLNTSGIPGHNESNGLATSASYSSNVGVLYPDNYLVSPQITLGGSISFYACAQDADWANEHFGVAVSTNGNTNAADFTTITEWTLDADGNGTEGPARDQGVWGLFTVDLSSYAGQTGYVAIRHFDCSDLFRLNVDDITIVQPGVTEPQQWTTINNNVTNPYALTGLSPETTYQVQVRSNCTSSNDGYSVWTNAFFTTLPSCVAPSNLTINNITTNSAVVTWTGSANSYNLKVNDVEYNNVTSPYTLSNLTAATIYTVEVQSVCDATSTSSWTSTEFVTEFCEEADKCEIFYELTDSYGDGWNGAYVLVVDVATNILIDYWTVPSGESTASGSLLVCNGRQLNFLWYSGNYDDECSWVITDVNGEQISIGNGDDYSHGATIQQYTVDCVVTSCRKPTDLQVTEISANSVTLTWTENGEATAWVVSYSSGVRPQSVNTTETTVTLTVNPETTYTAKVRPVCDVNNKWSDEISFTTPATCPLPSEINVETETTSATLSWTGSADSYNLRYCVLNQGTALLEEGFENGMGNWTVVDADGDNHNWFMLSELTTLYTYYSETPAWQHSGNDAVISGSYINGVGALTPDNWLISPQVTLGGIASFYAKSMMGSYPEQISVYVSTNSTNLEDFVLLNSWVLGEEWNPYAVDLSDYSGQGYIAIRNYGTYDKYLASVDDFTVEASAQWNTLSTTETSITIPNLQMNTSYAYQMQSVCEGTPTAWTTLYVFTTMDGNVFLTEGDWNNDSNWSGGITPEEGSNVTIRANVTIPAGYTAVAEQVTIADDATITIADGGQLYHNTDDLEVTMKKNVTAYTGATDNYKLLAFPFTDYPDVPEGMTTTEGNDFYKFNNSMPEEEWQNNQTTPITYVAPGKGYLYANPSDIELSITGTTFASYDNTLTMNIAYNADENGDNSGWGLIGNPFVCDAYIYGETYNDAGEAVDYFPMDVMYYDENGDMQTISCGPVAPMQGFFVKVTQNTKVYFIASYLIGPWGGDSIEGEDFKHAISLDNKVNKTVATFDKNVTLVEKKADKTFIILDKTMMKKLVNKNDYTLTKKVIPFKPLKK